MVLAAKRLRFDATRLSDILDALDALLLPGRGFEQAASVLGKNYAGTLGVDGCAPYVASRKLRPATTICCTVATSSTRGAVRFPRLVKAILRLLARSARMACALPRDSSRRACCTADSNQRFAKHLRRYRDSCLDRADVEATNYPAEQDIRIEPQDLRGNRRERGSILMSVLQSFTGSA